MTLRVALAGFRHQTNTFATHQTDREAFVGDGIRRGESMWDLRATDTRIGGAIAEFEQAATKTEIVPVLDAEAPSGGPVTTEAFELIANDLVARLEAVQPDALFLDLEGAMVIDDGEQGDDHLLRHIRSALGADMPLVMTCGPTANISQTMLDLAHLVPPTASDPTRSRLDHGATAARRLLQLAGGQIAPVTALRKLPMLVPPTQVDAKDEPMRSLLHEGAARIQHEEIIDVNLVPGFAFADAPDAGFAVLVTTTGDSSLASHVAEQLAEMVWEQHERFEPTLATVEEAVHEAMAAPSGPWILGDAGDNPKFGGPGDGTALLWALLDLGAPDSALGVLVDPDAVETAFATGVGQSFGVSLGAQTDEAHGFPVDLAATVRHLVDDAGGSDWPTTGRSAVLSCEGRYQQVVEVIVGDRRGSSGVGHEVFARHEIDPASRKIIVVKGSATFVDEPTSAHIIAVDTPGVTTPDLRRLPYRRVTRPIWPLDPMEQP